MSKGFARNGWPRGSEIIVPSDFVASATPHTKGSWVEVDASTAQDVCGMWIRCGLVGTSATDTSMLLDIGIGGSGSEVVVVSNIPIGGMASQMRFFLPLYVPANTRIAGRIQAAVVSDTLPNLFLLLFGGRPGGWGGYSIANTIGVSTTTSGPTTGDLADNAWDEAIASTANAYRALTIHPCHVPGSTAASGNGSMTLDIGTGAAGSEVVLGQARATLNSTETLSELVCPEFIESGIPAGSRLAIRKNGTSDLSAALIGWR